ncbi:MAG: hypothetical protein ACK5KO_13520 [Arachnia sp.]
MDSSNHWYGHAHALARYCGLASPPPIHGVVQHGWTFVHGFGAAHRPPRGHTKFVWSDECRRRGQLLGWRDYVTIGAPLCYLDASTPDQTHQREGTIWYPFHGTADFETVNGDHRRLIDEIKATETGPVTMCLYYVEYDQPHIRQAYEDAGFRVICHGRRGAKWAGGTIDFLDNQLRELRSHERVASNRLSTAVFYGISLGCAPAIYGDPMDFVGVVDGFDGQSLMQAWWPELFGPDINPAHAWDIANLELGRDKMADPEELAHLLGWTQ